MLLKIRRQYSNFQGSVMKIPRTIAGDIKKSLAEIPVTALLGPRQCKKTALVKML